MDNRRSLMPDNIRCNGNTLNALIRRDFKHDIRHHFFENTAQTAGARFPFNRNLCNLFQSLRLKLQLHAVQFKQLFILLHKGVLRLSQDTHKRLLVKTVQTDDCGQTTDDFRNQTKLHQVMRLDFREHFRDIRLFFAGYFGSKAKPLLSGAVLDNLLNAVKGTAADKQNIGRINLDKILMGMLAPALRGNVRSRTFEHFEQRLLHTFARYVAGDRRGFHSYAQFCQFHRHK